MPIVAQAILSLISNAPAEIDAIKAVYAAVKSSLSSDDQTAIDQALATAQQNDAAATAKADVALDAASKK